MFALLNCYRYSLNWQLASGHMMIPGPTNFW